MIDLLEFLGKLVPIVGVVIAYIGLNTWRRQIKGTDKYKVASELLLEVYNVREGISVVRTPLIQFRPTDDENVSAEMNKFYGYVEAMERRWKEVQEPISRLSLLSLKAEVHLTKDAKAKVDVLMRLVRELQVTYEQYVDVSRPGSGFSLSEDFDQEARKVLWAKPTDDDFRERVLNSVSEIELLVHRYL